MKYVTHMIGNVGHEDGPLVGQNWEKKRCDLFDRNGCRKRRIQHIHAYNGLHALNKTKACRLGKFAPARVTSSLSEFTDFPSHFV